MPDTLIERVRRASEELAEQITYLRAANVGVPADLLREQILFEAVLAILIASKGKKNEKF